jgi:hypothetical protein
MKNEHVERREKRTFILRRRDRPIAGGAMAPSIFLSIVKFPIVLYRFNDAA